MMQLPKRSLRLLLSIVSLVSIVSVFLLKPIPQNPDFHHFADGRNLFGIENCWNVLSNLLFLLVGVTALEKLWKQKLELVNVMKPAYYIFFIAVLLVSGGSAWYHHHPDNNTLVWDRLPMTIAFMSLLSIALAEFVSTRIARIGFIPFLVVGIFSIVWWHYGELHQHGDLRLYLLVQFLPMLLLLLLFLFGKPIYNTWGYVVLFSAYILAKLAEQFDAAIYTFTGLTIAGHLIKHVITAVGLWVFLNYLEKRSPRNYE